MKWITNKDQMRFGLCCIHKGIEKYVLSSFPYIALTYTGIDVGAVYLPALKNVPRIPQLIDYFVGYFWKRIALFVGIVAVYTVAVLWIVKPILIHRYWWWYLQCIGKISNNETGLTVNDSIFYKKRKKKLHYAILVL